MITATEIAQRLEIDEAYAEELLAISKEFLSSVIGARIDPQPKTHYFVLETDTNIISAPDEGPFLTVSSVTVITEDVEVTPGWKRTPSGETLTLDVIYPAGSTVAVDATCGLAAPEETIDQLLLMTCRYFAEGWRREYLPDIASISYSGVSMSYRSTDPSHPTGVKELDALIRTLRRRRVAL
ncbi:MAG: hypothetical protein QMD66_06675 [Actinomycetota bacterium]|jgi:hypothetical protein|nr:hypothetical protein [Actinomycetota bacterium]NPV54559.1 hypothetical protein [Bacillota bacterium]